MKLFDLDQKKNIESLISEGQTLEAIALIKTLAGEKSLMGKIAIALEASCEKR